MSIDIVHYFFDFDFVLNVFLKKTVDKITLTLKQRNKLRFAVIISGRWDVSAKIVKRI